MFRLRPQVDSQEGFYGLGEVFDQVEHRGKIRAMHFIVADLESGYNEAHVPIPLLVGTRGWGLFVESMRPAVFAVATARDDEIKATFGLGSAASKGLTFHLFAASHPLDVTRHYYDVTGWPGPIPQWALGPWIWRDEVDGQATVEEDLATIRELDLATTGYWIDRPYASAVNSFDFAAASYPDPVAMMETAHALGFAMALWHTPYLDPEAPATAALYEEAEASGFFPPLQSPVLAKWGPPLDFTNPDAVSFWKEKLGWYRDIGIVGYKLDYAEEVIPGGFGVRFPWLFHDGSDELDMHRGYQLLYHRTYAEMLPKEGGFLLCRAGVYGDQVLGAIIWPGDAGEVPWPLIRRELAAGPPRSPPRARNPEPVKAAPPPATRQLSFANLRDERHLILVGWDLRGAAADQGLTYLERDVALLVLGTWLDHDGSPLEAALVEDHGLARNLQVHIRDDESPCLILALEAEAERVGDSALLLVDRLGQVVQGKVPPSQWEGAAKLATSRLARHLANPVARAGLLTELVDAGHRAPWARVDEAMTLLQARGASLASRYAQRALHEERRVIADFRPEARRRPPATALDAVALQRYLGLVVDLGGEEDFAYTLWPRQCAMPSFTIRAQQRRSVYYRLEVHLREGGLGYDVMGYTKEQVIGDVLDQYEKHMHFLHMVR